MTKTLVQRLREYSAELGPQCGADLPDEAADEIERLNKKCAALAFLLYGLNPNAVEPSDGRIPTDGQLMDQLEAAFEKMNDGYVEQDLQLRRALADNLVRFNRPQSKSGASHGE